VVNTDPSGYMTNFGELLSTIATHSVLSSMAYVTGYATGTQIIGGDGLAIYDQFLAGFADGASSGLSTQFRAQQYGEVATRNHRGAFFNLGRVMGNVATIGLGWGAPTSLAGVSWGQRVAQLHEMLSTAIGSYQSTRKILEGRATVWDWLVYLPLITVFGSVSWNASGGRGITPSGNPGSAGNGLDDAGRVNITKVHEVDLHGEAHLLHDLFIGKAKNRTIAVARVVDADGKPQIAVAASQPGQLTEQTEIIRHAGYTKVPSSNKPLYSTHAELRLMLWAKEKGYKIQAIGVSHQHGICPHCYKMLLANGVEMKSPLYPGFDKETPRYLLSGRDGWTGTLPPPFYPIE